MQLEILSDVLDSFPFLTLVEADLKVNGGSEFGRKALTVDSVFRCMILKQMLGVSYAKLAFHLADSQSYRSFARVTFANAPSKSTLQSNIRRIRPETLNDVFDCLVKTRFSADDLKPNVIRIDSTVVKSAIAPPSDSKLLNDGIRVLSRYMATSRSITGIKIRFKDFRKPSKALAFRIFNAKKAEKRAYYLEILTMADKVIGQVERGMGLVRDQRCTTIETTGWLKEVAYYRDLMLRVMDQTRRRVIGEENVPANEKLVSLFEPHRDIIIKGQREVVYGHKINIASDKQGLLTHVSIEEGNAADVERYIPIIEAHQRRYQCVPKTAVADGGLCESAKRGTRKSAWHQASRFSQEERNLSSSQIGVKQKTFNALKHFRAEVEGNISELKRVFGLGKALWKGYEGFHAYVWASAIAYNLVRLARIESG